MIARDINETWTHTLKRQEGQPDAAEFILGHSREEARALDLWAAGKAHEAAELILKTGGLRGWSGMRDKAGNDIRYRGRPNATQADLDQLWPADRTELGGHVLFRNQLTERESD